MNHQLDELDLQILDHLQIEGRVSNAELARRVGLSGPGLQKRVRKLEEAGVITRYAAIVDRESAGFDLLCFVEVTLTHHEPATVDEFRGALRSMPEVLECHHLTGEADYLLKVVVRNHRDLEGFLVERLTAVSGVDRIRTSIVLREVKETTALPLVRTTDRESLN